MIFPVIIIGIIVYKFYFSSSANIKRRFKNTQQKKVSDVKNGEIAKIVGNIKFFGEPLIAPLSGKKCVYYYIRIEQNDSGGYKSYDNVWYKLIEEEVVGNMIVKDGNSYAFIETKNVKSYSTNDVKYSLVSESDSTEKLEEYLTQKDYNNAAFMVKKFHLRYKEIILEEKDLVAIVGEGKWKRKDEIKINISVDKILIIDSDKSQPVYFSKENIK